MVHRLCMPSDLLSYATIGGITAGSAVLPLRLHCHIADLPPHCCCRTCGYSGKGSCRDPPLIPDPQGSIAQLAAQLEHGKEAPPCRQGRRTWRWEAGGGAGAAAGRGPLRGGGSWGRPRKCGGR